MSTLVNSILEKIDNIRVSRDNLNQAITDKLNVDATAFKVIESMNYAGENLGQGSSTPGTPTESYAIRQDYNPSQGGYLAYPINVRLTTNSWVSFDFAMSEKALSKIMPILGVHNGVLKLSIEKGRLRLNIGNLQRVINYPIDTNRHNISFGFVGDVNSEGDVHFRVEIDNGEIYNNYIAAPNFNLPLFLFGCPNEYNGTYEDYEILGGVTLLLNENGIYASSEYYYIFGLKVYNVDNSSERNLIRDYEPAIDADRKPCLLEKLSNKYEYPTLGTYIYASVPNVAVNEISNLDYGADRPAQCYIKPSAGAIVPTDIKLTPTTRIVMRISDLGTFEASADATEEEILKSRVMVGAQPNLLISAYDENDIRRGLPGYAEAHSMSADDLIGQMWGDKGIYFGGCSNILYSTSNTDGNITQLATYSTTINFGYDVVAPEEASINFDNLNKILAPAYVNDMNSTFNKKAVSPTYSQFNNEMNTPICFFGNYNETTMKPDEVIALGYQEALSQIGYTTGIRYSISRIEIYDRNSDGSISRKHMLLPAKDTNNKVLLYDSMTEKSYYPFNGTLDVTSGTPTIQNIPVPEPPVEPEPEPPVEPEPNPEPTLLTGSYIKPSAGAIVPTDINFTSLTNVTMHVKGFDNFEGETDFNSRAMIGAQPNFTVSPFNRNDAEKGLPGFGAVNQEQLNLLSDSSIGIYFMGCGNNLYSIIPKSAITGTPQILTMNGEHVITVGYDPLDINNINIDTDDRMNKTISIDGQGACHRRVGPTSTGIYKFVDGQARTPICIFGNYNNLESMTPDKVIALGYENALTQIGYVTGARYGVKQIDIAVRNADGSMTTTHSLLPARDSSNVNCLYDTVSKKSYYPFHGTLDII